MPNPVGPCSECGGVGWYYPDRDAADVNAKMPCERCHPDWVPHVSPAWQDTHCPRCAARFVWDGETEASRVCLACRIEEAELWIG